MMSTTFFIGLMTIVSVSELNTMKRVVSTTHVKIVVKKFQRASCFFVYLFWMRAYATSSSQP